MPHPTPAGALAAPLCSPSPQGATSAPQSCPLSATVLAQEGDPGGCSPWPVMGNGRRHGGRDAFPWEAAFEPGRGLRSC